MSEHTPGPWELKPCPFCGGTDIRIESNGIGDYYAICGDDETGCGARTDDFRCEGKQFAAQRWNMRSDDAKLREQAKRSDKFREQLRFKLRKADEINAELMEACKQSFAWIDKNGEGPSVTSTQLYAMLEAAIAKAEGRE